MRALQAQQEAEERELLGGASSDSSGSSPSHVNGHSYCQTANRASAAKASASAPASPPQPASETSSAEYRQDSRDQGQHDNKAATANSKVSRSKSGNDLVGFGNGFTSAFSSIGGKPDANQQAASKTSGSFAAPAKSNEKAVLEDTNVNGLPRHVPRGRPAKSVPVSRRHSGDENFAGGSSSEEMDSDAGRKADEKMTRSMNGTFGGLTEGLQRLNVDRQAKLSYARKLS